MLDVSVKREEPDKAIVYLDGPDGRLFKALVDRLGSEKSAQNAIILVGLLDKLGKLKSRSAPLEIARIKISFPEFVGVSYESFRSIVDSLTNEN